MKISMDKKYQTRDGRPVRLLCVDDTEPYPVVAIIGESPRRYAEIFKSDGTCRENWRNDPNRSQRKATRLD